ncbi:GTPase family protein [Gloeocapsa sp. PCC 73106]|uniref:GTPase family protein n=1 Tax=Gloeocapsa sp. PCC 73106 TaxID=102232 RepID=UPI0002ABEC13|nr:GTPase [Gloeocapsa sp. PCC 73106]ELS00158.1 putative GTPase [Gloeocapsa sp. PCC 73106]
MKQLKLWQWLILGTPFFLIVGFILIAAGFAIAQWGINWIWAVFVVILVIWRWLLVKWTRVGVAELEAIVAQINADMTSGQIQSESLPSGEEKITQAQLVLKDVLQTAASDPPIWKDSAQFWQRCQELVVGIAKIYHPEVKYPLLNIYIPQGYGLIRGTIEDLDRLMDQLSPTLNQVTVGQAYQAYEVYQRFSPSASKLWQAWNWSQWLLNPTVAIAKQASKPYSNQANQELLVNLSQIFKQAALYNLCQKALLLYSGETLPENLPPPPEKTQSLKELIETVQPEAKIETQALSILLVGRTGSGKSSLINTIFRAELAQVDVLPSTVEINSYQWQTDAGESLTLWDSPGYEQVQGKAYTEEVLEYSRSADLILVVNPALDPALQMDVDFLQQVRKSSKVPTIMVMTQVDRLRPLREWDPPYDWQQGNRAKETAIREAIAYRRELLGDLVEQLLPVVNADATIPREGWGIEDLSLKIMGAVPPAKELRLVRFLRDRSARVNACAKVIDKYIFQMSSTQGLTALLKSPILTFITTISSGSPELGYLLAQQIPVEELPVVIGKLQLSYELYQLLKEPGGKELELLTLWPLLSDHSASPQKSAWALGRALIEYWSTDCSREDLKTKYQGYLTI